MWGPVLRQTRALARALLLRVVVFVVEETSTTKVLRHPVACPLEHRRHVARRQVRELCKREGMREGAAEHGDAETTSGATPTPSTPRVPEALEAGDGRAVLVLDALVATRSLTTTGIAELVAPTP